jgi:serine/threonine protein kinase/Tol biopolymer transport system component
MPEDHHGASLVGRTLGVYQIQQRLGAGGMGEVYRAHDTRLRRDVTVKILPRLFTRDADRLARFEREARIVAALNHPHIGAIYGVEEADGVPALILEFIAGETLADRLRRGALPVDECLGLAGQIAEALEAAHERHIVHRDLKPANINVTPDGVVKVLDFGLAKAMADESEPSDQSESPTLTAAATRDGIILGTAAYMSPEQARGRPIDRRTDMWAFGAVLYEMLTGRRAFEGDTVSDTIARVLTTEPDWTALPPQTPFRVRTLLRRCLAKDRKLRLDSATAVRLDLLDASSSPTESGTARDTSTRRRVVASAIVAAVMGASLTAWGMWALRRSPTTPAAPVVRFALPPPPGDEEVNAPLGLALTPDGRHLVYAAEVAGDSLMIRPLDQLDATTLPGIRNAAKPFMSPDGRWIGYFGGPRILKVPLAGGPAIAVCATENAEPRGASWGSDNTIVFATNDPGSGLWRVSDDGGQPSVLTTPDPRTAEGDHVFPWMLPAGRGVLFTIAANPIDNSQIAALDLKTGQRKILIHGGSDARYIGAPPGSAHVVSTGGDEDGYLVFATGGALRAVRFDLARLEVTSDPVTVVESVQRDDFGGTAYAVSPAGALVYVSRANTPITRSFVWVDRQGRETATPVPAGTYELLNLSPDGTRAVVQTNDNDLRTVRIVDLARGTVTPLTPGKPGGFPIWSADGRRIIFNALRGGRFLQLYTQAADGTGSEEQLTAADYDLYPNSATPDGTGILVAEWPAGETLDIALLSPPARTLRPLVRTPETEFAARIAPNGRYFAYLSSQPRGVYVRSFPAADGLWQVATIGHAPVWARSERELFYRDESNRLMAVPVDISGPAFSMGTPAPVFKTIYAAPGPCFRSTCRQTAGDS